MKPSDGCRFRIAFCCAAFMLVLVSGARTQAQSGSYPMEVISANHQDVSLPLRDVVPFAPDTGTQREHPLHPIHPLKANATTPPDGAVQTNTSTALAATAGANFEGLGQNEYGFTPNSAPPDTNASVGSTQMVEWVNESFAIFNKSTGALVSGPITGNTLWSGFGGGCQTNNDGDPIVHFDRIAQRWVFTQFSVSTTPYLQCVAVSTTADATGTYNRYSFQMPNFPDYPKLGVWPDAYYMTFNMFSGNSFVGGRACALNSAAMQAGTAATAVCFQLSSSFGGLLPADLDGATAPPAGSNEFFLNFGTNSLNLWKFHVDFTNTNNSTFTGPTNLAVATFSEACGGGACIQQAGTSQKLDSLGDRLMYRLAYRNFGTYQTMVAAHSVKVGTSRKNPYTGVRWYEIRSPGGTPAIYQQSTYSPDATFRWMPSIAMDKAGDIALGYSASSSAIHPAVRYTGRVPSDPLGTLGTENSIIEGTGSQTRSLNRWGDYSSMALDPSDDCTFWYANEYIASNGTFNWHTRLASFKFPTCH
jgi:hypothetical protein